MYSTRYSDTPEPSADPNDLLVEDVFSLYQSCEQDRSVQYFAQEQIVPRTNDYKPEKPITEELLQEEAIKARLENLELRDLSGQQMHDIISEVNEDLIEMEKLDPLKGNALVTLDYMDRLELALFSAGSSLSHLVIASSEKKKFDTEDHSVSLPYDTIQIFETVDLQYPIRQVTISPFSTFYCVIFAVRTTSTIHLMVLDEQKKINQIDYISLADQTSTDPRIDYSLPLHVELSPHQKYKYMFITNNGYVSIRDGQKKKTIFAGIQEVPDDMDYISRWGSCAFGKTLGSILIATPKAVEEWKYKGDTAERYVLTSSDDPIVAFKASRNAHIYVLVSLSSVIVVDNLMSAHTVAEWKYDMSDGRPFVVELKELPNDKWRFTLFSQITQCVSIMDFHYTNRNCITPEVKILDSQRITLSPNIFEDISEDPVTIRSTGFASSICTSETDGTEGYTMLSFLRTFEDGSMSVQYIALTNKKLEGDNKGKFKSKPHFQLVSDSKKFDELLTEAKFATLPYFKGVGFEDAEVVRLNTEALHDYLDNDISCGHQPLLDDIKAEITSRVRSLDKPTTVLDLLKDIEYQNYDHEELMAFLKELEVNENIKLDRQVNTPGVFDHGKPLDEQRHRKLAKAHERDTLLSSTTVRPVPPEDNIHKLKYLNGKNVIFKSTTTSKVLASLWTIDDTNYNMLQFPRMDTNVPLKREEFPSGRNRRSNTSLLPLLVVDDEEEDMPATVQATPLISKTKKTKKTKAPTPHIVLNDNNAEEPVPRASSSQMLALPVRPQTQSLGTLAPPSPARPLGVSATQPTTGTSGSTKKSVPKKKKKPKTSGFR